MEGVIQKLFIGHAALFVCSCFYIIWWSLAFRPQTVAPKGPSGLFFACTALFGVVAIFFLTAAVLSPIAENLSFSVPVILIAGAVSYIVLLIITGKIMDRPATSELFFIVLWVVLELAVVDILQAVGLEHSLLTYMLIGIGLYFLLNMICYLQYYHLSERAAFITGMIPLGVGGIFSLAMSVLIWLNFIK